MSPRVCAAVCTMTLATVALADSYPDFVDTLEIDRHGVLFADVRGTLKSSSEKSISVVVWTRLHPNAIKSHLRQKEMSHELRADSGLSAGPVRTVYKRTFNRHPALIRLCSSSIAILDYHGINYGELKRGNAVQFVAFERDRELSLRLDDIFANGTERYHNGRGRVSWLQDAWFDETERRLFLISTRHPTNPHGREVAIIDLDSGLVAPAGGAVIKEQLARVESRFLHNAFDAALDFPVEGITDIATRIFADESMPLAARTRAAAHLAKLGNTEASRLIREMSAFSLTDPADVRHHAISRTLIFEDEYWWNTIGYAAKVHNLASSASKR